VVRCAYSWHLVPEADRTLPDPEGPETRALLQVVLVDAETGLVRVLRTVAVDPELAQERADPGGEGKDHGVRFATGFLFLVTVGGAAMDVGRIHQSDDVPPVLRIVALAAFAASLALQAWAMIVNPFFSPAIRVQPECGHRVITHGPYRFVRDPGYLAMLIAMPESALAVGSWLALIPAIGFSLMIVRRARLEDGFLKRNLPGYIDYMQRVRGGLLPRLTTLRAAVLLHRENRFTYWIVFFDGEEALKDWSASDSLYGSRHFAQALTRDQAKQIRAMIKVDMIGDRNLHIHRDSHSSPQLPDLIFREAQELGYGRYFLERRFLWRTTTSLFSRSGSPPWT
jgi:protein-S-isoprenylcysteine O-methyltransferase Ste14